MSWKLNGRWTPPAVRRRSSGRAARRQVDLPDEHALGVTRRRRPASARRCRSCPGRSARECRPGVGRVRRVVAERSSLSSSHRTSTRKPSMPRSNQKRRTSSIAASTSGLRQFEVRLLPRGRRGSTTAPVAGSQRPGAARRTSTASCSAARRRARRRPRCTSRAAGSSRDERDSTNQGCCVGRVVRDEVEQDADAARVRLVDQRGRDRRACRRADRRRGSRRRRSRSRPSASGRSARARWRRRRARRGSRGASMMPGRSPTPSPSVSWNERG